MGSTTFVRSLKGGIFSSATNVSSVSLESSAYKDFLRDFFCFYSLSFLLVRSHSACLDKCNCFLDDSSCSII